MDTDVTFPIVFTNYARSTDDGLQKRITILDAAMATSAATTFFDKRVIEVDGVQRQFGDAALGDNNPIDTLLSEATNVFGNKFEDDILQLVSIGTGLPPSVKFDYSVKEVLKALKDIAEGTERRAEVFHATHPELVERGAYFRITAPDLYVIKMDAHGQGGEIMARMGKFLNSGVMIEQMRRFQRNDSLLPSTFPN